jgi:hypothetical protein
VSWVFRLRTARNRCISATIELNHADHFFDLVFALQIAKRQSQIAQQLFRRSSNARRRSTMRFAQTAAAKYCSEAKTHRRL